MEFESVSPCSAYTSITNIHCKTTLPINFQNITWRIENFSCCTERYGEKIDSSIFYAGNTWQKWNLEIFPNGFNRDWNGMVAVLIKSHNNCAIPVKYIISIVNNQNNKEYSFSGTYKFQGCGERAGSKGLIRRDKLFGVEKCLLPNDCLTISCELYIVGKVVNQKRSYYHKPLQNNLSQDLITLFHTAEYSDISISVGEKKFKAHKAILAARSPVFSAMFKHEMNEKKSNNIIINDIHPHVMEEVLCYIYSGKCNKLHEMAEDIVRVADKYNIDELKEQCEQFLCSSVTLENALSHMVIADMHNLRKLKSKTERLLGPFYSNIRPEFIMWLCRQGIHNNDNDKIYFQKFMSVLLSSACNAFILELFWKIIYN